MPAWPHSHPHPKAADSADVRGEHAGYRGGGDSSSGGMRTVKWSDQGPEADSGLVDEFQAIGYLAEAVALVDLVPLIEIAWADDCVSIRERDVILESALRRGVAYRDPAYRQLVAWLTIKPPDPVFRVSLRAIGDRLRTLSTDARAAAAGRLLDQCRRVATVSGGLFCGGPMVSAVERRALERIANALTRPNVPERAA